MDRCWRRRKCHFTLPAPLNLIHNANVDFSSLPRGDSQSCVLLSSNIHISSEDVNSNLMLERLLRHHGSTGQEKVNKRQPIHVKYSFAVQKRMNASDPHA